MESFSNWQSKVSNRHPLVCQVCTRIISGLIVATLVAWWGINNIPAKTVENVIPNKAMNSSEISIKNEGLMPANIAYSIVSPDTTSIKADVQEGTPYVSVENTKNDNVKLLHINNLPSNRSVKVGIVGSDIVELGNPSEYKGIPLVLEK